MKIDDLLELYPDDKVVYVDRSDNLLFLLGGETREQQLSFRRKGKKMYIYGAGGVGKKIIEKLESKGIRDFGVVVTKKSKSICNYLGHEVIDISSVGEKNDDVFFVIATKVGLHSEIIDELKKYGFTNYCLLA